MINFLKPNSFPFPTNYSLNVIWKECLIQENKAYTHASSIVFLTIKGSRRRAKVTSGEREGSECARVVCSAGK